MGIITAVSRGAAGLVMGSLGMVAGTAAGAIHRRPKPPMRTILGIGWSPLEVDLGLNLLSGTGFLGTLMATGDPHAAYNAWLASAVLSASISLKVGQAIAQDRTYEGLPFWMRVGKGAEQGARIGKAMGEDAVDRAANRFSHWLRGYPKTQTFRHPGNRFKRTR